MPTLTQSVNLNNIYQYSSAYQSYYAWKTIADYPVPSGGRRCWFGNNGANNSICIPVPIFRFNGTGTKIKLTARNYRGVSNDYRWALCTSMNAKTSYQGRNAVDSYTDRSQLGSGTFSLASHSLGIDTLLDVYVNFNPNTQLYLYLWSKSTGGAAPEIFSDISIQITYTAPTPPTPTITGIAHIDNGTAWGDYTIWIDNGSSFEQYEAYIDTGSQWVLLT